MRSTLLILLTGLIFAATPARAQSTALEENLVRAICKFVSLTGAAAWSRT